MSDFEPVKIDFMYGGNTDKEGKKIEQSLGNITAAAGKAQADVKKAAAEQANIIKQIEKDIKGLENKLSKTAPGAAKMALVGELNAAKKALAEEKAALEAVNASIEKTGQKHVRLRTQVMELKDSLARLEMQGKRNTPEFDAMAQELGRLNDQMGDTSMQAKILADDQKGFKGVASGVSGLAGALSAATGVAALFGAENEELARIQTRLQAVMAITIGVQQVSETLNKDSYFTMDALVKIKKVWAAANLKVATTLGISTVAAKAFTIAITGGLILAVTAAIAVVSHFASKQAEAKKAAAEFASSAAESAAEPLVAYKKLQSQWNDLAGDLDAKKKFVTDNKDAFEDLGVEVNNVVDAENLLVTNTEAFQQAMIARAKAAAATELATEQFKKSLARQAEVNEMSDTIQVKTASQYNVPGNSKPMTTYDVANQTKIDAQKKVDEMSAVAENYIKMSEDERKRFEDLLKKAGIKQVEDAAEPAKQKAIKEVYDAESAITKMILDIRNKRTQLEINQQQDSLKKRIDALRFERDEEIRKIEEKEADILAAYNKSKAGSKGFVAKTSISEINPALAKQLANEQAAVVAQYRQREAAETDKYQQEISDKIFKYADERTQIAYNYNKEIADARALGLTEWADDIEKEKNDRINAVTLGMLQETDLYQAASDDKLQLTRETTELLIADLQRRIDAEIAAGRLTKEAGEKWLNDLATAREKMGEKSNPNNPFSQLGDALRNKSAAKKAFTEAPVGTSTAELAKLEDAAAKATAATAAAAGSALMGVKDILGSVVGGLDRLGMLNEEQKKDAENIIGMVGGAADIAMGIATGNPMAIIQGSIDLIVNAFEFFDFKNKELEKQQKQNLKNVENLEKQYQRLQRAVDKALGTDIYKAQRDQIENQKRQIREYEAWLAAENQKKKRKQDAAAIADTKAKIQALRDNIQDEVQAITESLAQTSVKDLASQLSDALVNAFRNGESAAEAMGNVVDDVLRNAVINALKLKVLDKLLAPAIDQFADDLESGGGLSGSEADKFRNSVTAAGDAYFKALNEANDALGGIFSGDSAGAQGIKGDVAKMTEQTGSALVGQITGMRLNVAELLLTSRNSLESLSYILSTLEDIRNHTVHLQRIDETLIYLKLNGIQVK